MQQHDAIPRTRRVKCIVVTGPTATGKTRLGVGLALACDGEIVSADSRQVWGTVGVSENIIEASWMALVDAFEYKLHREDLDEG